MQIDIDECCSAHTRLLLVFVFRAHDLFTIFEITDTVSPQIWYEIET